MLLKEAPLHLKPEGCILIAEPDCLGRQPLEAAVATQQWPAVQLLVAVGALESCTALGRARQQIAAFLPDEAAARAVHRGR